MKSTTLSSLIVKSLCLSTTLVGFIGFSANANATTAYVVPVCIKALTTTVNYSGGIATTSSRKLDNNLVAILSYKFAGFRQTASGSACPIGDNMLFMDNSSISENYASLDGWSATGSTVTMYLSISSPTYRLYINGVANKNFKCNFNGANSAPIQLFVSGRLGSQLSLLSNSSAVLTIDGLYCKLTTNMGSKTVPITTQ